MPEKEEEVRRSQAGMYARPSHALDFRRIANTFLGNNCIKGAFVCAGYPPQRGAGWPKMIENKPGGVPLESKDPSYVPPGAYGMPASPYTSSQAANNGQPSGPKREPLPQYRGQNLRIEPPKGADGPSGSPEHKHPPGPYTPGTNPYPTPVSANTQPPAFGDRGANDYQRHHDGHAPPVSSAQRAAQMALSHAQAQPHNLAVVPYDQRRPTQKEEMLQGGYFYQYDSELSLERDRAATACWRFNTLTYPPTNGVSTEERARLFLEIMQPRESSSFPVEEASVRSNVGRVGRHVAVESPFHCDYGYNISIGNNVSIGKGCTMNDAGKIQIGDNCIIGPNVSMYTIELSTDPKHRQGGHGAQLGKGIIVDSDCWIGGGVIIMPGKVIGKGSTIGAGSVVTKVRFLAPIHTCFMNETPVLTRHTFRTYRLLLLSLVILRVFYVASLPYKGNCWKSYHQLKIVHLLPTLCFSYLYYFLWLRCCMRCLIVLFQSFSLSIPNHYPTLIFTL